MYGYRVWFNDFKYTKISILFCAKFFTIAKEIGKNYILSQDFMFFIFLNPKTKLFWINVVSFLFMATIDSQTIKGFYFYFASSRKRLPFIAK